MLEVTMETNVDVGQGHVIIHLQPMGEPIAEERVWRSRIAQVTVLRTQKHNCCYV